MCLPDNVHRSSTRLKEVSGVINHLSITQNALPDHLDEHIHTRAHN